MRLILVSLIYFLSVLNVFAQSIQKRLILIGDAGEINSKQTSIIDKAVDLIIKDSTMVFYLGDNIYPNGMGLEGKEKEEGVKSLQTQFESFQNLNVPVYFMAGNHDWNVSRPGGLEKLKAQENYLKSLNDKNISFVPSAGEPGPVLIDILDDVKVVVYDSEYWLYPYHADGIDLREERKVFTGKLSRIFEENKDKIVLVFSHHPMITYGEHSLSFGWKQHIFPLTRLNKYMYFPLPVVGSLFPLWRGKIFISSEDLPSKAYQELIESVMQSKGDHRNVLFGAGHDHGLQYIESDELKQIVSGSGSKSSFIRNNKNLKFKYQYQGFCVIDYMDNSDLVLSYYILKDSKAVKAFESTIIKK